MNHTNQTGKQLAITGLVLQLFALCTLIFTLVGISREFNKMSATTDGSELAGDISNALYPLAAGSVLGLIGSILILFSLFSLRYRAPWFHKMVWVLSILWLMAFPVGTIVGVAVIIYLVKHKDEFKVPAIRQPV